MNVPFVDLKKQYLGIKSEVDEAISEVINNTAFIGGSNNKYVSQFEENFAKYLDIGHCVTCANGTDALEILLKAANIGNGDEVIVPAVSWISTSEAVSNVGANPVFVDIEESFHTIDPELIEEKITSNTKAIIPVHLYGCPAKMNPIIAIARKHGLFVLEDCAQAHGAVYEGAKVGTIGHAASFSFYPGKNLGAYGDAGAIVTNDSEIAQKARLITNHGQLQKHDHQLEGRNSRMDGIQAAVLDVKLNYIDSWNKLRKEKAAMYREALNRSGVSLPTKPSYGEHVYHLFVIKAAKRDELKNKLKAKGVQTAIHYPNPLPFLKPYMDDHRPGDFPVAYKMKDEILSLPIYPEMPKDQIIHVCDIINQF